MTAACFFGFGSVAGFFGFGSAAGFFGITSEASRSRKKSRI